MSIFFRNPAMATRVNVPIKVVTDEQPVIRTEEEEKTKRKEGKKERKTED